MKVRNTEKKILTRISRGWIYDVGIPKFIAASYDFYTDCKWVVAPWNTT